MSGGRALTLAVLLVTLICAAAMGSLAKPAKRTVRGKISLVNAKNGDPSNVAVWLEPVAGKSRTFSEKRLTIRQRDKQLTPRVIIATVGTWVDFPNDDPFPHNIFSNSEVKRFDLGTYQGGESHAVPVTRPGIIPVYCNIHPKMQAFIVVVETPYYGLSDEHGEIRIKNVPSGKYRLKVWHERAKPETLEALSRLVSVGRKGANLGTIEIDESGFVATPHKNKEGQDYVIKTK